MLILTAQNVTPNSGEVADYNVSLRVNHRVLWSAVITEHPRERGAAVLLRRIVNQFDEDCQYEEALDDERREAEGASGTPG